MFLGEANDYGWCIVVALFPGEANDYGWYVVTCSDASAGLPVQLMIGNEDLRELGIPMGPRKKLASFISTQGEKIRAARVRRQLSSDLPRPRGREG